MFQKFKRKFIGDREFYKNLLILIIPIIIQQGITNFVSLLDNVMVGRLGTESMSGVAIVNQLLFVFNITVFGGLSGASIYGAQYFGKGDHDGVRYAFRFKLIFSAIIVGIATFVLLCFRNPLISLFLSDSDAGSNLTLTLTEAQKKKRIFQSFNYSNSLTKCSPVTFLVNFWQLMFKAEKTKS